jgi:hypothetical protein
MAKVATAGPVVANNRAAVFPRIFKIIRVDFKAAASFRNQQLGIVDNVETGSDVVRKLAPRPEYLLNLFSRATIKSALPQ